MGLPKLVPNATKFEVISTNFGRVRQISSAKNAMGSKARAAWLPAHGSPASPRAPAVLKSAHPKVDLRDPPVGPTLNNEAGQI